MAFEEHQRLVERSGDGGTNCWGEVLTWEPPDLLKFTWHPGDSTVSSTVTVTFEPRGDQTLLVLEHHGWEAFADPEGARAEYDKGWPMVLDRYSAHALEIQSAPQPADATWVALLHRAGPNSRPGTPVVEQPEFAQHVAFLNRMRDKGYLVAAGPLSDINDEGMTVLRLPGADRVDEATRLATEDDASVANGFFTVTIRPWQVVLT